VVIAAQRDDGEMRSAQAYLASSLRRWLLELKRDGAGRIVSETMSVCPVTRRRFTRAQIIAIIGFGTETGAVGGGAPAAEADAPSS
jgi:hypothetical protein